MWASVGGACSVAVLIACRTAKQSAHTSSLTGSFPEMPAARNTGSFVRWLSSSAAPVSADNSFPTVRLPLPGAPTR